MALTQVSTAGVKDDAVTSGKIPANAVGSSEIAANAVGSSELADNAVDTNAIQDDAVTSDKIADDAITTAQIATNAVSSGQINDNAVGSNQITSDAVVTSKIAAGAITTNRIADQAVTLDKLPHGTSSNDGKFLRANNGADPSFETVSIPAGITINNQTDNRVITATGTTNTLNGESNLTFDGSALAVTGGMNATKSADNTTTSVITNNGTTGGNVLKLTSGGTGAGTKIFEVFKNNQVSETRVFQIDGSGKVGIGTASPSDNLHIADSGATEVYVRLSNSTISNGWSIGPRGSDGRFQIVQNGVRDSFFIDTSGNATVNSGNLVIGTSGKGIDFSATSDAGGASHELLDDYEEGSWTPTVTFGNGTSGQSYNYQVGRYIKIGRLMHIQCYVAFSSKGSSTGTARLSGLPYAIKNVSAMYPSCVLPYFNRGSSSAGPGSISSFMAYGEVNQTTLNIQREQLNDSTPEMNDAQDYNFADDTEFMLTMTYITN